MIEHSFSGSAEVKAPFPPEAIFFNFKNNSHQNKKRIKKTLHYVYIYAK